MAFSLSLGIKEEPRPNRFTYPTELFARRGPYGDALEAIRPFLKKHWPKDHASPRLHEEMGLTLVHECEQAKAWLQLVRSSGEDYEVANRRFWEENRRHCTRAIRAIDELLECDRHAAYSLRSAFSVGLGGVVPPPADVDYILPDQNRDDGGLRVKVGAETRQAVEFQFALRAALGDLDRVLRGARSRLEIYDGGSATRGWPQLGNLRFDPPLSAKSKAAIGKNRDVWLGVAVLGLAVSLSAWFRECSANGAKRPRWVGEPLSVKGQPHWALVAEFINAAFEIEEPETAESLRQRFHSVCRGRNVRIMSWPRAALREPQVQKD